MSTYTHCSPLPKGSAPSTTVGSPGLGHSFIGLVGSAGSAIVSEDGTIRKRLGDGEETVITPEPSEAIPTHFVRCIRDGLTPKVTGYDARAVLAIVLAIQESSRTGEAILLQTTTQ